MTTHSEEGKMDEELRQELEADAEAQVAEAFALRDCDEKGFLETLELDARTLRYGCGIYLAGDTERCYVKLFVTDSGCVMPLPTRNEEDLMTVYQWGRQDGERAANRAKAKP